MNTAQVMWAELHDWYRGCRLMPNGEFEVTCLCVAYFAPTGELTSELVSFTDFQELRAWAGY